MVSGDENKETAEMAECGSSQQEGVCAQMRRHMDHIVILVLCFWINVQSASSISCLGVLLVEFMEYYRATKAAVTWVAGAHMGVSIVVGPVIGILLKKFGFRTVGILSAVISSSGLVLAAFVNNLSSLYVTFGIMAGSGPCSYYAVANSSVQHYFKRRRSLACAAVLTAFSIGGFLWPPFCRWLIDTYCWQGALLIIGALHLQLLVPFMILGVLEKSSRHKLRVQESREAARAAAAEIEQTDDENKWCKAGNDKETFQNGAALTPIHNGTGPLSTEKRRASPSRCLLSWLFLTCVYSGGVCFGMILHAGVLVYTPVRSWQLGLPKSQGAILVSIISAAGGFCRIPAGLLGDLRRVNRGFLLASAIIICGILAVLSQFVQSFFLLAVFSAVYGCIIAVYLALQTVVLSDLAGLEHLPLAMGILLAGHGLSSLLLHPIAGSLMDLTGSANTVFITVGFVGITGGTLVVIVTALKIFSKRRLKNHDIDAKGVEEAVPLQVPSSDHVASLHETT